MHEESISYSCIEKDGSNFHHVESNSLIEQTWITPNGKKHLQKQTVTNKQ